MRDTAPDLALELTHAAFPGVLADDGPHGVVRERHMLVPQGPDSSQLSWDQILLRDLGLLQLRVSRKIHDLHAVEQWARNVLNEVRGRDEQHLAQIERHAQVMIGEGVVLRGIEHFEQRALDGSPWNDTPSLSTSSMRKTGFLVPACFIP